MKQTPKSVCYPVSYGHFLPSWQAERQRPWASCLDIGIRRAGDAIRKPQFHTSNIYLLSVGYINMLTQQ